MAIKKTIFQIHKTLGLATGLVVFIVALTGCFWAFKDEIESLYNDYKKITPQDQPTLTLTEVKVITEKIFPNNTIHGSVFRQPDDAIEVIFYDAEPEFYQSIFLNPYSGEVIQVDDHLSGFFAFVLKGHVRLWLPLDIGEHVVGVSVLLFLIIVISGFILWLPKKRKNLKQRLKFDWKSTTRWKRKNFDLHSIIGFYIFFLAFIIAFTGAVMSYNWLSSSYYNVIGGKKTAHFVMLENMLKIDNSNTHKSPIDNLLPHLKNERPNAKSFEIHYPYNKDSSILVEIENSEGLHYDMDYRFFDQNDLTELETPSVYGKSKNATIPDKILLMNYDIHIGAIGGIAGKIIAFLISLLTASLPITGFLLWYGRNYKKKKTNTFAN